ncbi:hypothetical protein IGS61_16840 [Janthinobacterium sp. FW305-129]|uniref:hypothetical protein n=1 Tax=Janthinobacterium sp. FW305-129 TaxID=2775054 RepID=UPI001E400EDE|nr:hypothetical protein [Janthinobacterium sp. FW305-129]MCC7599161.1 hypothetical protein [Janthinobacterium sp. FW305-129]
MHDSFTPQRSDGLQGGEGQWRMRARGNQLVLVAWAGGAGKAWLECQVSADAASTPLAFRLSLDGPYPRRETVQFGNIDVSLNLSREMPEAPDGMVALVCELPLSAQNFFHGVIATWAATGQPAGGAPEPLPFPGP